MQKSISQQLQYQIFFRRIQIINTYNMLSISQAQIEPHSLVKPHVYSFKSLLHVCRIGEFAWFTYFVLVSYINRPMHIQISVTFSLSLRTLLVSLISLTSIGVTIHVTNKRVTFCRDQRFLIETGDNREDMTDDPPNSSVINKTLCLNDLHTSHYLVYGRLLIFMTFVGIALDQRPTTASNLTCAVQN